MTGILSINLGNASINPSANPIKSCIPALIIISMLSSKESTIVTIVSTIWGTNVGNSCARPCTNATIICIPPSIICGSISIKVVNNVFIIWFAPSIIAGKLDIIPCNNVFNIWTPESNNVGKFSLIFVITSGNTAVIPFAISWTLGNIFWLAVITLSTKLFTIFPIFSVSPVAIPVNIFCHADFIAATEPWIVVLASFAVVPVTPSSPCITWIAWYTSFKLLISYLIPVTFSASESNLCISSLVPP